MPIIVWTTLIALSFIFLSAGLALVMFFTFYYNEGKNSGLGAGLFILAALVIAVIWPNYVATPIIPAAIIATAFLVMILGLIAYFFLPYFDNQDAITAFRPLIMFSIASGILVAVFNLAKIIIA